MSLSDQMELPYSVVRVAKDDKHPFTPIDNRALQPSKLSKTAQVMHLHLLSKPDDWDFKHASRYLAKTFGCDVRTAQRALREIRNAGLVRDWWNQPTRESGKTVFELPVADRSADPKAVTVTRSRHKGRHLPHRCGPPFLPRKSFGRLEEGHYDADFLAPERGATKMSHIQKKEGDVLHSSEHPLSPKSPASRGPSFSERLREESQYFRTPTTTRRAKRRKGRQTQAPPKRRRKSGHSSRTPQRVACADSPAAQDLGRLLGRNAISGWRSSAKADIKGFLENLDNASFNRAFAHLLEHRVTWRYEKSLKALQDNPLLGIVQRLLGLAAWTQQQLRRVLKHGESLWKDIIMLDYGRRAGALHEVALQEVRARILSANPRKPERHQGLCQHPDFIGVDGYYHQWEDWVDGCKIHARDVVARVANAATLDGPEEVIAARLDGQLSAVPGRWSNLWVYYSAFSTAHGEDVADAVEGRDIVAGLDDVSPFSFTNYWMPA